MTASLVSLLLLIGATVVVPFVPAASAQDGTAPIPDASLAVPGSVLLGESFTIDVTFDNLALEAVGYGPYLDVYLPVQGADGDPTAVPVEPPDGVSYLGSATYLGADVNVLELTLACDGSDIHPFTGAAVTCPPGLGVGDVLLVVELPFGSFTTSQPPATVMLDLELSELADLDVPLSIYAAAGFRYGADPLDNPDTDPPIVQAVPAVAELTPTLLRLSKSYLGEEDETATGPNFPVTWSVELTVADGQVLTDVVLTDLLPDNVAFLAAEVTVGTGSITTEPADDTPRTDAVVEATFPTVTGTGGVSAAFDITFYVPDLDAAGEPVIDPDTGTATLSANDVTATGDWDPIDDRDEPAPVVVDEPGPEHVLTDRSLAIQKSVAIVEDVGASGPSPGDTLEWTLTFQVSDYFSFEDLVIEDVLSDGQSIDASVAPRLTFTDATGSATGFDVGPYTTTVVDDAPTCADDGSIQHDFDLSAAVAAAVPATGGRLTGGLVDDPDSGPTQGTLTFRTVIDDRYRCLDDGNAVDSGDPIGNEVVISGDVVRDGVPTVSRVSDDSAAGVSIVAPSLSKTVYARNGDTGDLGPRFAAGDTITYRLTTSLPLTNFEGVSLTDFLPLPVLLAGEVTTAVVGGSAGATPPPAGTVSYGPDHTGAPLPDPTVAVDTVGNSLTFTFADIQSQDGETSATIDLLFTVTLSDQPFADGLFLTNQARLTFADSFEATDVRDEIVQFELTNPQPAIHKGAVATDGIGTFRPAAVGPADPWTTDGTPRFAPDLTSGGLAATPLGSDLDGTWAGDLVAFAIVVENTGSGINGAFDVTVTDTLPDGMVPPTGGVQLQVTDGTGTPLGFIGDLFGAGLVLDNGWDGAGTGGLAPFSEDSGRNLAVITYVLEVDADAPMGQVATNTATVSNFASAAGGDSYPEVSADATVTVADPVLAKTLTGTDQAHTISPDATIGETATYEVVVSIPPSSTDGVVLSDRLDAGLAFVSFDSLTSSDTGLTSTLFEFTGSVFDDEDENVTVSDSGRQVDIALGTLTNATDTVQTLTFTSTVVVLNVSGNQDTTGVNARRNRAELRVDGISIGNRPRAQSLRLVEPALTVAKSVDPAEADAGDTVTFTIEVEHAAGSRRSDAFDAVLTDLVPDGLTYVDGSFTHDTGLEPDTVDDTSAPTLTASWASFPVGESAIFTFAATVDADAVVAVGPALTNTVDVSWTSLPGDTPTSASPYDTAGVQRTGDDGPGGLNDYATSDTATLDIAQASVVKAFVEGSAAHTAGNDLTIGEVGTFQVTVTLPEGDLGTVVIEDAIPAGLAYVAGSLAVDDDGFAGTLGTPGVNLDPDGGGNGADLVVTFDGASGDGTGPGVVADSSTGTTDTVVVLTYDLVVLDVPGNVGGQGRTNAATVTIAGVSSEPATSDVDLVEPALSIQKAVAVVGDERAPGRPEPGDPPFTYTVTVTNADTASDAFNVVVIDTVPTGIVVDTASISTPGVYVADTEDDAVAGTITWVLSAPLGPGASIDLTYSATLAPSVELTAATLTNTAAVASSTSLPAPEDGREYEGPEAETDVTPAFPSLSIDKSLPDGPLTYLGEPLLWQLVISNVGDGRAFALEVVDVLPPNWEYVAGSAAVGGVVADPAVGTTGGVQTLTWSATQLVDLGRAELPPGASLTITFLATPTAGVVDDPGVGAAVAHTNSATVSGRDGSGADGNADGDYTDTDDADARIDRADLVITKTTTDDAVAGLDLTWAVTVRNDGPDTAVGPFTVTDTLPAGVDFVSVTGTGWDCGVPDADRVLTCVRTEAADTLADQASFPVVEVTVAIPADTAAGTELTNVVGVTGRTYDPDVDDPAGTNADEDTVTVSTSADLAVTKQLSGALVAGLDATYTVRVQNLGPSISEGPITVTDVVPDGTAFVSADGDGWSCSLEVGSGDELVTCERAADLAVGQVAPQIVLVVTVDSGRTDAVVNTATVSGTTDDPNVDNDEDTVTTAPATSADLGIEKALQGDLVAGADATYRLTVTNFGPSDAVAVVVTDDVPSGMVFDVASGDGWVCVEAAGTVTCDLGDPLSAGDASVLELTFTTSSDPADLDDPVRNTAVVSSDTPDPNPSNDESTDDNTVAGEADLSVVKSHEGAVLAGEEVTFDLVVANAGPSDAAAPVTVTDVLPDGMTFVDASGSGWDCAEVDGTVTCTLVDGSGSPVSLAAGATAPSLGITVLVDPSAGPTTLRNIASVDSSTVDPVPGDNTTSDDVVIGAEADLSIEKATVGADPVLAGERTSFEVRVTNAGPSTAELISVVDTLPSGVELVSVSGDGWSCEAITALTMRCDRAVLLPGAAPVITVVVDVLSGVPSGTVLTNLAAVSAATPDPNPDDNQDDSTVTVDAEADLVLSKTGPDAVPAGGQVVFDLELTNDGPSDAIAPVRIVDQLPVGMTYLSATGSWDCEAGEVTDEGQEVSCLLEAGTAALAAGATAPPLTLRVLIDPTLDEGVLTNRARADSPTVDPDPDRAEDAHDVEVTQLVDLVIVKSHDGPVRIGDPLTFLLQVRNDGPSVARDVQVVDVVPDALVAIGAEGDGWTCVLDGQSVTCDLDEPLAPETAASPITIEVEVAAAAYPTVVNTAVVSSSTPESDEANNISTDTVAVPPQADLAIDKSHVGSFVVGRRGTFSLLVTNLGPTPDPGPITVVDDLPAGLVPLTAAGDGWACDLDATRVTCVRADGLDVGQASEVVIEVRIEPTAAPRVVNEARVSSGTEDTDPSNDRDEDLVPVTPVSALTAAKEAVSEEDGALTWEITVGNEGPNATTQPIVVVDELVDALTYRSSAGDGWICEADGQVVTCAYADSLPVGGETVLTLVTDVDAPPETRITNVIRVTLGSDDIDALGTVALADAAIRVGELARTGVELPWLVAVGLGLLGLGATLVARRRRELPGRI